MITVNNLGKRVPMTDGELVILEGINLEIKSGESVAIIGASGSGKSTLLGLLAGLDTASEGQIHLDNQDLTTMDEDGRAALRGRNVGFVFQSFQLLPALTAQENVMLPLELKGEDDAVGRAAHFLDRVGLDSRRDHYPRQLSGGEQQRVAVARSLINNPSIVLADEPSGNLDSESADTLHHLFFKLREEFGQTFVIVTHNQDLANMADRKLTMVDGVIV